MGGDVSSGYWIRVKGRSAEGETNASILDIRRFLDLARERPSPIPKHIAGFLVFSNNRGQR